MSKPVLGRSLGTLLGTTKGRETPSTCTTPHAANGDEIGQGLRTLLNRVKAEESSLTSRDGAETDSGYLNGFAAVPAWYFFGADLILLFLAGLLILPNAAAPSAGMIVLAGIAVALGALLAVLSLIRPALEGTTSKPLARWIIARQGTGDTEKTIIVCLDTSPFVAEVQNVPNGKVEIVPLSVEGSPRLAPTESESLAKDALAAYKKLLESAG